ncbi:efflux transporter periplasmic adaptor subunit, partial [bacterium]|nr:efflux transporter periplasmic adaptor subunit [bacterium]
IEGKTFDDVVVLPRTVLRDHDTVVVVDSEDRLHFREVEVLRLESESVYIAAGLQRSDRVCLSILDTVVEGMHVRPFQEEPY